ncbi:MAG: endonuclease Q family protein, partial [Oscillospiraceae bacterium]|nr:endonuclease Q family protein [Oscillospiraceae bacterium]
MTAKGYLADLHIHSRFSMATSRDTDPVRLDWWARRKGLGLIGTGDCLHPGWLEELEACLTEAGDGVCRLREELVLPGAPAGEAPRFLVSGEVSAAPRRVSTTPVTSPTVRLSTRLANRADARAAAVATVIHKSSTGP